MVLQAQGRQYVRAVEAELYAASAEKEERQYIHRILQDIEDPFRIEVSNPLALQAVQQQSSLYQQRDDQQQQQHSPETELSRARARTRSRSGSGHSAGSGGLKLAGNLLH
jgi:hypothetical protein